MQAEWHASSGWSNWHWGVSVNPGRVMLPYPAYLLPSHAMSIPGWRRTWLLVSGGAERNGICRGEAGTVSQVSEYDVECVYEGEDDFKSTPHRYLCTG